MQTFTFYSNLFSSHIFILSIRRTVINETFDIKLKLNFSDGCGCPCTQINIPFDFKVRGVKDAQMNFVVLVCIFLGGIVMPA